MSTEPVCPFEGPEKLLELWFAPSPDHVFPDPRSGLRAVPGAVWEEMLAIVKCKVLSKVEGKEIDAYLLSESSLFISSHRLILKTCGTTLNLLGVPRILEIAAQAGLPDVYRCFYSRKSFMFPERQSGPHRDWKLEVEYLDNIFDHGAAYIVGKMNGDHWLLYMANHKFGLLQDSAPQKPISNGHSPDSVPDYTIEILMSELAPEARQPFFAELSDTSPSVHGTALSQTLGIADIFPRNITTLDAHSFSPCGYSSNALISWNHQNSPRPSSGEGYYTIHVTPEDGWSYASFECNVPLPFNRQETSDPDHNTIPDLQSLVQRVVSIFQPGRLSLTLFISSKENEVTSDSGENAVDAAQGAFRAALVHDGVLSRKYNRTDKINYEFGDYDLVFASFELQ